MKSVRDSAFSFVLIAVPTKSLYTRPRILLQISGVCVATFTQLIKTKAYRLVFWQLIVVAGLALIMFLLYGFYSGFSTLLGGLAYCVPNLLFVWRVFSYAGTSESAGRRFMVAFFAGELLKIFFSAILFLLIVKYLPIDLLPVLIGFIGAIVSFWIVSAVYLSRDGGEVVK